MRNPAQHSTTILRSRLRAAGVALALICEFTMVVTRPAQAQTLTVLHNFTSGGDGSFPIAGLTMDSAGNFYGTTAAGGYASPELPLWMRYGPDEIYGSGQRDGLHAHSVRQRLDAYNAVQLPPGFNYPYAHLTMDPAGNLYGTTSYFYGPASYFGGQGSEGSVFKLALSNGSWTYIDLHDFDGRSDGGGPFGSVVLDTNGNLYGTGAAGGTVLYCSGGCGVVWEITP